MFGKIRNVKCIQTSPGVYALYGDRSNRLFSFLSGTSFHIKDPDAPVSPCVECEKPIESDVVVSVNETEVLLSFGQLSVCVDSLWNVRATYRGKEALRLSPYREGQQGDDNSLAEKEGHGHYDSSFGADGFQIVSNAPVYGLGERTGCLNKRGYDYIDWNTDDPSAHVDTFKSLYQSVPFFLLFDQDDSVGVFVDNTARTHFDFGKTDPDRIKVSYEDGVDDLYFFFGSMAEVCRDFSALTGRNALVPYFALGAQQCRWSYPSIEKVEQVIRGYRENDLPLSVIYLDIDYMDGYRDFTIDESRFPNIREWLEEKRREGIYVVPIIDAGVKAEEGYFAYDEGVRHGYFSTLNGELYHNEVWPGESAFPAFLDEKVRHWWAGHVRELLDLGFAGIWNDMNEPASFRGPLPLEVDMGGVPHRLAHNVYGHFMCKSGAEGFDLANKRVFQLTRAGYAGTCRYSSSWTGDNQSIYDHMRLSLPQLMNMSLSGQAYVGVDIGGFGGDMTPELLAKWAIAALLNPLYRNHSSLGTMDQEPYVLKGKYLEAYRNALRLRYALRPTLYTELYLAETEGSVPLRPLLYNYPGDPNLLNENSEVMYGKDLLLIPSLQAGETVRAGYFPDDFVSIDDGKEYAKGHRLINVGLDKIPLFIRKSGLIVMEENESTLRLVWGGGEGASCLYYEDAGEGNDYRNGAYLLLRIDMAQGKPSIHSIHQGFKSRYQKLVFRESQEIDLSRF